MWRLIPGHTPLLLARPVAEAWKVIQGGDGQARPNGNGHYLPRSSECEIHHDDILECNGEARIILEAGVYLDDAVNVLNGT